MATWKKIITSGSAAELSSLTLDTALPVAQGGIGATSLTDKAVLISQDSGTDAIGAVALTTNGQIIIGGAGGPAAATITGTSNEVEITNGANSIQIGLPNDVTIGGGLTVTNDITLTNSATDIDLIDNNASALSFDATDKTGILEIVTTNGAEQVNMSGNLDVSGIISGSTISGSFVGDGSNITGITATVATTVTITDNENTNEDNAVVFTAGGDLDGGNLGLESDGDLTYNPSTGRLTATQLAGTLQTAAQTNITSVGALNAGSITSGFTSIDVGAGAIGTTGTVSAGRVNTTGGVHVGGTSDPGTDNLIVDGTSTLTGDVTTTNNVTIGGDLTVNGTTTTIATTNTEVADQFLFLASGSAGSNLDAGIVVQSGSAHNSGSAFYHDMSDQRWSVAKSVAKSHIGAAQGPTSFVTTVKTDTVNPDATSGSYGAGEMHVNTSTGDIWIRFG